jgi:hypothetical protein
VLEKSRWQGNVWQGNIEETVGYTTKAECVRPRAQQRESWFLCSVRHSDWQFFRTLAFSLLSRHSVAAADQPLAFLHHVWQRLINRRQKVSRMKRVWWNCCIAIEAATKADLWVDSGRGAAFFTRNI